MTNLGLYLATWTLFCTCTAIPDIHRQMSPIQLQSVFHVDKAELVPNYEIIKLTHQTAHHIRRRHIETPPSLSASSSAATGSTNNKSPLNQLDSGSATHHVKKDLSKTPYYSDVKSGLNLNNNNNNNYNNNKNNNFNFNNYKSSDSEIRNINIDSLSNIKEHNVSFEAFGEVLNLTLKPTKGLFKDGPQSLRMWNVKEDSNATQGLDYEEILQDENNEEHVGDIFQDEDNMAAILMRRHIQTGDLMMEGSIGHELVIRPLPTEIIPPTENGAVHHVVFKRQSDEMDQLSDFAYMEPDRLQKRYRRRRSPDSNDDDDADEEIIDGNNKRTKRSIPHIIYPEILVIVDYDGYRLHGGDNIQVKRYFVAFWNGVDLRYRLLKGPRIRISIAGIIISRGRDATPYLERNRVGRDAIDSAAALTDMGKYLFRERRLPVYDIAVAITKYDMCRRRKGGRCTKGTAGFAYVGGACVVNKRLEKVNSVAIIEDTGGFSGIIVAAHEVGHLLGAVHDGSPPPSYLGGPGAEKCRWEDGYIMSDLRHTERGFRWSACTIQSFHHFLNGDTASCLHNAPHEDEALGRSLPGTLLSLDAQCRRDRGTSACFKDERVCSQLFCFDAASGYCVAYRPAAEGSVCGDGLHCLDGRCVAEHENIIPDYSQHTPSYASPNAYNIQLNTETYNYYEDSTTLPPIITTTTTRPTTTTTTTTSTTTTTAFPQTTRNYFNNIFFNNFRKISTSENPFKSYFPTTTAKAVTTTTATTTIKTTPISKYKNNNNNFKNLFGSSIPTTTPLPPPSTKFNSFFYGFQNNNNQQQTFTTRSPTTYYQNQYSSSTTINPIFYHYFNQNKPTTTIKPQPTQPPPPPPSPSAPSYPSSTRNPIFDVYLSRIATTTKNPYNFDNFGQYFKTSTQNPKFAYNYFGLNSNNSPINLTVASAAG